MSTNDLVPKDEVMQFTTREDAEVWMEDRVDDACMDNSRFAYLDDPEGLAEFDRLQALGCCGEFEAEIRVGGRLAKIGCNYGH